MDDKCVNRFKMDGEIQEMLQIRGKCNYYKVMCYPQYIVIAADDLEELYLGDKITLEGKLVIEKSYHMIENKTK